MRRPYGEHDRDRRARMAVAGRTMIRDRTTNLADRVQGRSHRGLSGGKVLAYTVSPASKATGEWRKGEAVSVVGKRASSLWAALIGGERKRGRDHFTEIYKGVMSPCQPRTLPSPPLRPPRLLSAKTALLRRRDSAPCNTRLPVTGRLEPPGCTWVPAKEPAGTPAPVTQSSASLVDPANRASHPLSSQRA